MARQVVVAALLALILPIDVVTACDANICLSIDGENLNIVSDTDIYGFQLNHNGCASDASQVLSNFNSFQATANMVLAADIFGSYAFIPSGSGVLLGGLNGCDQDALSGFVFSGQGGSATTVDWEAGCTDVAYNMGGGNWDVEMSFTINGETYTAGEGIVCLVDGCYPVTLSDSFGDGWNGGLLTLGDHLFGMPSGFTADGQISMNAADCPVSGVLIYGCTDAAATNYNADANDDDDSCAYDCDTYVVDETTYTCYWYVWVYGPSYGYTLETVNGWGNKNCACVEEFEPIYGCTDAGATNYNAEANSDDDSCAWDCDTLAEYTAGNWAYECSFTITDCDGNVLASMASGSDGFAQCVEWGDNYSISLADSYGDGWNGGTLNVGGTVYDVAAGGSSADFTVGDCAGAAANGDPHLKNIKGESFDVMQTGNMLLLEVPRGSRVETLEFAVHGDIERLGLVECGPTFITKVVMAGRWLEFPVSIRAGKSTHKPFGIQLNEGGWKAHADFEKTTNGRMSVIKRDRAFLMKVDVLDIAVSMPNRPRAFLDLQIKGIGKITAQVGGLLGLDDHTAAESLPSECNSPKRRRLSVLRAEVGEEWSASAAL